MLAGTIQLSDDREIGVDNIIQSLFGAAPIIPSAKGLAVEGTATLLTPLTLNGGTFSVGDIVNSGLLNFQRGTVTPNHHKLASLALKICGKP